MKENLQHWSKTELARVVIQRMLGANVAPAADHPEVVLLVKRERKARLVELAELALTPSTGTTNEELYNCQNAETETATGPRRQPRRQRRHLP